MLNLLKNEYIKLFKRGSVVAATIILFLIATGLLLIFKVGYTYNMEMEYVDSGDIEVGSEAYYQLLIERSQERLEELDNSDSPEGYMPREVYENNIKMYQFMIDNQIYGDDDWRGDVVSSLYDGAYLEGDKEFEDIKKTLVDNDFESYVKVMAELTKNAEIKYEFTEDGIKNIYQYMIDEKIFEPSDWRYKALLELQVEAADAESNVDALRVSTLNYRIINGHKNVSTLIVADYTELDERGATLFMQVFGDSSSIMVILCGIIIIFAGMIVATEHTTGTIKFLITNPVSRGKIIVSKYITVVSLSAIGMILLFAFNLVVTMILCGTEGMDAVYLRATVDGITESSLILNVFSQYCLEMIGVIAYGTMAFAISSFAKSTAVAVAAGIMSAMGGSLVAQILAQFRQDWGRYLIFSNTSLSSIYNGESFYPNQSITFALVTIGIYVVIFFMTAYDGFTRREV